MADLMRTSNPALRGAFGAGDAAYGAETMTISGAVNKTGILIILCVLRPRGPGTVSLARWPPLLKTRWRRSRCRRWWAASAASSSPW